jgi:hypothetical protein
MLNLKDEHSNLYDIEFLGLLKEINKRLDKYSKNDIMKIQSWIKYFMLPVETLKGKKNRNLYAIKLINNLINGRIEEPFTKFAKSPNDMKWLSFQIIKSELSKKFYDEINCDKVEQEGYEQYKKLNEENKNNEDIEDSENQLRNNLDHYDVNDNINELDKEQNELDKFKLGSIIQVLTEKNKVKDEEIEQLQSEINEMKNTIITLEKKAKIIKGHQLKKQTKNK